LEKAVAAHEQVVKMARRQFESGTIPQSEVAAAESKLSDVKISLFDRKRGTGAAPGTQDPLANLTRELQSLSIDTVDRKARLAFVEKRIVPLREAAASVSDFELLESERAALRTELEQARQELRTAERAAQASAGGDRVVVVKSQDGKHQGPEGSAVPEQ
jgi:outer membrane protein TolC